MLPFAATILLSAFLLFEVQPLLGKYILPWFGGGPAVWNACLLFFQALLLAGYLYSHVVAVRLTIRGQVAVHCAFVILALWFLPISPSERWKVAAAGDPTWRILGLLSATVAVPYLLLASSSPLMQRWFAHAYPERSPYRLYALSNAGSLLALLSYPTLVEPLLPLRHQVRLWSWLWAVFGVLTLGSALALVRRKSVWHDAPTRREVSDPAPAAAKGDLALTFLLAGCSATLLMAITNLMCLDIAAVPFLWVLPLTLYLLSFVICFQREEFYVRVLFVPMLVFGMVQSLIVFDKGVDVPIVWQVVSYCFTLASVCMFCHGELVRLKPHASRLTSFYLAVAAGGAAGGTFVSLAAPRLFKGYWEFQIGLGLTGLLILVCLYRDCRSRLRGGQPMWAWSLLVTGFGVLIGVLGVQIQQSAAGMIEVSRSFYGILRILEDDRDNPQMHRLTLMNGRIDHGFQYTDEAKGHWPTSYYGSNSGVGLALGLHPQRQVWPRGPLRIGVVGLGTGTLATYGEAADVIRFYEINPEVIRLSRKYFSYLRNSLAAVEIVLGDARISMENEWNLEGSRNYDVLAVDAFSSDAIPIHLLTRECFELYWRHLKTDGILAVHISSRYLDLSPVLRSLAEPHANDGMVAVRIDKEGTSGQGTNSSDWVLITRNREFLRSREVRSSIVPWPEGPPRRVDWTDDYSNLLSVLQH